MSIRVAVKHHTSYVYDRPVQLSPHVVRLRPAPHCRTPVLSYSLRVEPPDHFINWQQDPQGNYQARLVFPKPSQRLTFDVELIADLTVINPFDFFLDEEAKEFPFTYSPDLARDLRPYLHVHEPGPKLASLVESIDRQPRRTIDFLVDLNMRIYQQVDYIVRMEAGVQTAEETLTLGRGSCRDSAWLLLQVLRHLGLASRFVSGYLVQLTPDVKSLDGPSGPAADFTDLHAWAEVYLPGAGWVGLDPTSGLLAGEGHLPLACAPDPWNAAPISGATEPAEVDFSFAMSVTRIHEDPRVTKPYTEETWQRILAAGDAVDLRLQEHDVRLTMGGEPTFVSVDDMEGAEWRTEAIGPTKRGLAENLLWRLKDRFTSGGLIHHGMGKWYPGESLPRWATSCYWRLDGEPIWQNVDLLATTDTRHQHTVDDSQRFLTTLAEKLDVDPDHVVHAYEDAWYYLWRERRLPINVDARSAPLEDPEERARLASIFERGLNAPVGCVLPLRRLTHPTTAKWESGLWPVRTEQMFLIPGDSPIGFRLPLTSLPWMDRPEYPIDQFTRDPLSEIGELPGYQQLRYATARGSQGRAFAHAELATSSPAWRRYGERLGQLPPSRDHDTFAVPHETFRDGIDSIVRTAICAESRDGQLHIFMPPVDWLEDYLELIAKVEQTADDLQLPVVIEGYPPPRDPRLQHIKVTPDPGVIEVNVHPATSWREVVEITTGVYEDAHHSRLGTEKFDLDGKHTGTGGGNHVVLGGPTANDSPFLRRPDLLRSLIGYWHNHPSLSYLFSGAFIGPTSQAPRVDEGRRDASYELQIAFQQIGLTNQALPWHTDRIFRDLLVDITGNTHRAEFCIDKLFSPDSASGRLGLVEFRAFEMPPHSRMSLTQQLLLRSLIARFWDAPYVTPLVDWNTAIHDQFMLPHFVSQDFADVIEETQQAGFDLERSWFDTHFEFRFPRIGEFTQRNVHVELRRAIEPWYVLGEDNAIGGTARYVDSSVERLQVKVEGMTDPRHIVTCNGRKVPLHPTGTVGEYVAAVRYRAWQPPRCLHPEIPVDTPLTFDLVDTWLERSLGGCQYHVGHPGGLNPATYPINSYEAESRRATRFFQMGHSPGKRQVPPDEPNRFFPMTLDLRFNRDVRLS